MILPFFDAEENGTFLAKSEQIWPFLIFEDLSCLRTAFAKFGLLNFFGAGNPASDILIYVNTERWEGVNLAEVDQKVKGVIIGLDDDLKLKRALSVTNNIEFLKSYDKELREVSKKLYKVAQDYYTTRTNFAKNNCQVNKMLASLMLNENFFKYKNFGIEKLIIVLIKEALENNNIKAIRLIDDWELTRAKYKALDRAMEALKSEQMALMSIMKNTVEGEKFSNVT